MSAVFTCVEEQQSNELFHSMIHSTGLALDAQVIGLCRSWRALGVWPELIWVGDFIGICIMLWRSHLFVMPLVSLSGRASSGTLWYGQFQLAEQYSHIHRPRTLLDTSKVKTMLPTCNVPSFINKSTQDNNKVNVHMETSISTIICVRVNTG